MNKLYVVGMGPGEEAQMTKKAKMALEESEVIIGYTVYVELLKSYLGDKEFITTPMKKEKERCEIAFSKAQEGKIVSMVCSGDAGVYGMAGLLYEMSNGYLDVTIEVVPGITAALSGAAILGAPLTHDFSVISLSDLLTPLEKIEKRIRCAAEADFVICLYNPASKKRSDYLQKACDIILNFARVNTVCGIVKNIGRDGEEMKILSLGELRDTKVDMFTTVFIGNSQTMEIGNRMVTPRGYY